MTRSEAAKLRGIVEQAAASLPDKEASEGAALFPRMRFGGALIKAGTRINWHGVLKQAAVDLWDEEQNSPDNAPTLWQDISYRNGIRIIPQTITVTEAFAKGEQGWWGDAIYESLIDANVYTPEQYASGWAAV